MDECASLFGNASVRTANTIPRRARTGKPKKIPRGRILPHTAGRSRDAHPSAATAPRWVWILPAFLSGKVQGGHAAYWFAYAMPPGAAPREQLDKGSAFVFFPYL